jgi:hypothetical protein
MWFIIRATFCVGVVFSMTPGAEMSVTPIAALSSTLPVPAMGDVVDGAISICERDPKLCFELAQRLAGLDGSELARTAARAGVDNDARLVGDTLTAADRAAAPWHGPAKEPRATARLRPASRPTT